MLSMDNKPIYSCTPFIMEHCLQTDTRAYRERLDAFLSRSLFVLFFSAISPTQIWPFFLTGIADDSSLATFFSVSINISFGSGSGRPSNNGSAAFS